jgi:mycofactocin glycosyltransferase
VPDITVYIPAYYNVTQFLPRAMESLLAQTLAPAEILVIDNGSKDDSPMIAQPYPGVTVVRHQRNSGLAAACNTAFRVARGGFVASLYAGCVAEPAWLELAARTNDRRIAGAGRFLPEGAQTSIADRWRAAHMPQEWGATQVRNAKFLFGCNNIFRRAAVPDAGGYDESMRTSGEDGELSRQLYAKRGELIYDRAAQASHLRSDSLQSRLDPYWRRWKSGVNAYASGISLRSVAGQALFVYFRHTFLQLFSRDLRARHFGLLPLDVLFLACLPCRDFRLSTSNGKVLKESAAGA